MRHLRLLLGTLAVLCAGALPSSAWAGPADPWTGDWNVEGQSEVGGSFSTFGVLTLTLQTGGAADSARQAIADSLVLDYCGPGSSIPIYRGTYDYGGGGSLIACHWSSSNSTTLVGIYVNSSAFSIHSIGSGTFTLKLAQGLVPTFTGTYSPPSSDPFFYNSENLEWRGTLVPPPQDGELDVGAGSCPAPTSARTGSTSAPQATQLCIPANLEGWARYPEPLEGDRTYEVRVSGTVNLTFPKPAVPEGEGWDAMYCYPPNCPWVIRRSIRVRSDSSSGAFLDDFGRSHGWQGDLRGSTDHIYTVTVTGVDILEFAINNDDGIASNNTGAFYVEVIDVPPPQTTPQPVATPQLQSYGWQLDGTRVTRQRKKGFWIVTTLRARGSGSVGVPSGETKAEDASGSVRVDFLARVCRDRGCKKAVRKVRRIAVFSVTGANLAQATEQGGNLLLALSLRSQRNWPNCARKRLGGLRVLADNGGSDSLVMNLCGAKGVKGWRMNDAKTAITSG